MINIVLNFRIYILIKRNFLFCFIPSANLYSFSGLLSVARCESEENALVTCSLKSGDVESAKIPRAQCLILIDLFNAQDKELDFIGKLISR